MKQCNAMESCTMFMTFFPYFVILDLCTTFVHVLCDIYLRKLCKFSFLLSFLRIFSKLNPKSHGLYLYIKLLRAICEYFGCHYHVVYVTLFLFDIHCLHWFGMPLVIRKTFYSRIHKVMNWLIDTWIRDCLLWLVMLQ